MIGIVDHLFMNNFKNNNDQIEGLDCADNVIIASNEGVEFLVSKAALSRSGYLCGILEMDSECERIALETPTLVLTKIIDWLQYHTDVEPPLIPRPLPTSNLRAVIGVWNSAFVSGDRESVYQVLLWANFLSISTLFEICCARVASDMLGKTPRQIRETFGIDEGFTRKDEVEIREKYARYL